MAAEHLDTALLAWLGTYFVHSTLLLVAAWILARLVARSRRFVDTGPAIRESLWRVALLAGLVTATVQRGFGVDGPAALWTIEARTVAATVAPAGLEQQVESNVAPSDDAMALRSLAPTSAAREDAPLARNITTERPRRGAPLPTIDATFRAPYVPIVLPRSIALVPVSNAPTFAEGGDCAVESAGAPGELRSHTLASTTGVDVSLAAPGASSLLDSISWSRVLLTLWLAGIAACAASWLREWRGLRRRLARRVYLDRGSVHAAFARLCQQSGTHGVRLSCAPALCAPITLGLVRAEIAIPPRATTQLSSDELDALFAHELAHVRRGDPLWLVIYRALEVVFFFQPLNRIARVRLVDEAELLADDWAATQLESRVSLASCLTEIAGWLVHERHLLPAPAMAARGTRLSIRVRRLLDEEHCPENARRPHGLLLLAGLAVTGVALFGPGVAATRAVEEAPSAPSAAALDASASSSASTPLDEPAAVAIDDAFGTPIAPADDAGLEHATTELASPDEAPVADGREPSVAPRALELEELTSEIDALRRAAAERALTPEIERELAELLMTYDALAHEVEVLEALLERLAPPSSPLDPVR
ncbi:MAG: M56 family metallopeptidase [Planctomycetes bacterium]|nr:M56 family metallopeptidase [Planctomycetota bacterium]